MKVKTTHYNSLEDFKHEGLRDEAESWVHEGSKVVCGEAICVPDDGSGKMYGFYDQTKGKGLVAWGITAELSDWIEADSLESLFKNYVGEMN